MDLVIFGVWRIHYFLHFSGVFFHVISRFRKTRLSHLQRMRLLAIGLVQKKTHTHTKCSHIMQCYAMIWHESDCARRTTLCFLRISCMYKHCGHTQTLAMHKHCGNAQTLWPCTNFGHAQILWQCANAVAMHKHSGHAQTLAMHKHCGHAQTLWPCTNTVAMCKCCGLAQILWPCTNTVAMHKYCGNVQILWPCTNFGHAQTL